MSAQHAPLSTPAQQTAAYARAHACVLFTNHGLRPRASTALAELRALKAENACLRDELRRHASGALQIRAAHRNARHDLEPDSERCLAGFREMVFTPLFGRLFRR